MWNSLPKTWNIAGESMRKSHPRQGKNRNITNSDCHVHAIQNSNPSTLTCYNVHGLSLLGSYMYMYLTL